MSYRKQFENALTRNSGYAPGTRLSDIDRVTRHVQRPQQGVAAADEADVDVIARRNAEDEAGDRLADSDHDGLA